VKAAYWKCVWAVWVADGGQRASAPPPIQPSFLGDPGAKFLVETGHPNPNRTNEKLTKFRELLSQSR